MVYAAMNPWGKSPAFGASSSEASKSNNSLSKSSKDVLNDKYFDKEPSVELIRTTYKGVLAFMCLDLEIEKLEEPFFFSLIRIFSFIEHLWKISLHFFTP